ncbi:hypothetical protein BXT92_09440, partial [Klebsiella pneumoniae]
AQSGLSSLSVIYYSAQLFSVFFFKIIFTYISRWVLYIYITILNILTAEHRITIACVFGGIVRPISQFLT